MHDSRGAALKVGDRVLIEAEVTELQESADPNYCNVCIKVVTPAQRDTTPMVPPTLSAINTKMLTKVGLVLIAMLFAFGGSAKAELKWTGDGFVEVAAAAPDPVAKKTVCGCAKTGKCLCWASECQCAACGLGGAAKQAPKPQASSTTRITPVPRADTRPQPEPELGSSAATRPAVTYTLVPSVGLGGSISGCANGQCQSSSTRRFRR